MLQEAEEEEEKEEEVPTFDYTKNYLDIVSASEKVEYLVQKKMQFLRPVVEEESEDEGGLSKQTARASSVHGGGRVFRRGGVHDGGG